MPGRETIAQLITMPELVDLIIPRGGKGLIEHIAQKATVNILKHLHGNCHYYVDKDVDIQQACELVYNSKTRRYGVCNALESLLVHTDLAEVFLKQLIPLFLSKQVELRVCGNTMRLLPDLSSQLVLAQEQDWFEEYLAPILAIKLVESLDEAIEHINTYGSNHTDAIATSNYNTAQRFLAEVRSSSVMVNAATGFADGFEYGLGAEIGISTDRFHARGPVGLKELTISKYIVLGKGQIRP